MLSDESSSDSETGRFKCRTSNQEEHKKNSNKKDDNLRSGGRSRPSENNRFRREFDRRKDERERNERRSRERVRFPRHSPIRRYSRERNQRRNSRDRSPRRKSRDRHRHERQTDDVRNRSKLRGNSKDKHRHSRSRSHKKSPEQKIIVKEAVKKPSPKPRTSEKFDRKAKDESSSPEYREKRSVVHKPEPTQQKKKSNSPIVVEELRNSDASEEVEVQPGSYYSMIPAVIKEKEKSEDPAPIIKQKSEDSSEIDSSDDERLRAKLLNLEKELSKTRKKKHKKKHKRKSSNKGSKDRDRDTSAVEVSSTTDIDKALNQPPIDAAEVTSTQKSSQKESSEEGEITSDTDLQDQFAIDPTDLRHKLKRSKQETSQAGAKDDVCGPALPPHLQSRHKSSPSPDVEGPALPPHLHKHKSIGPTIPEDLRKVLAESDHVIKPESSDEDVGIGPLPTGAEDKWSEAHQKLEERALEIKIRKLDGQSVDNTNVKSREQWMLELPEAKAKYLGLEARSFRAKEGPDMSDRSSWTDTPEEKARKAAGVAKEEDPDVVLQRDAKARHIAARDEDQERAVKKHKKKHKREESLLDLHQKKLKKKKKKEDKEEKKERRPFSRDVDLQVNRFDEAQKKAIIKKAQNLDTRFSRGEAKYL